MCTILRVDQEIERIGRLRHRIIVIDELRTLGLSRDAVGHRVERRRLQRLWPGTYLVGAQPPGLLSLAMGAVASYNGNGLLSHLWAAWLWGYAEKPTLPIDVTVIAGTRASRKDIEAHSGYSLDPRDITRRRNIPVTTPAATCLALAETTERYELERLVAQAQVMNLVKESQLHDVIARSPGRRGVAALAAILADGPQFTRAKSERLMLQIARDADLPRPETNVRLLRYEVDFLWREHGVVVEVDGYSTHGHRTAFEYDRRRQQELTAAGYRVMHVTWRQLNDEPMAVAARISAALAHAVRTG